MLDPQLLRNELDSIAAALIKRGMTLDTKAIQLLEEKRKAVQVKTEELQSLRNSRSKEIGQLKAKGEDAQVIIDEVATLKTRLEQSGNELETIQKN